MRVTVLAFATVRQVVGVPRLEVEVGDHATVDTVWQALLGAYPALAPHRSTVAVAVDEAFARFDTVVQDGSTVALLPPVSGG